MNRSAGASNGAAGGGAEGRKTGGAAGSAACRGAARATGSGAGRGIGCCRGGGVADAGAIPLQQVLVPVVRQRIVARDQATRVQRHLPDRLRRVKGIVH